MTTLATALRAQAATLLALAATLDADPPAPLSPRWYSRTCLPQGARSWRPVRERALRLGLATVRVGREVLIDAAAWDASLTPRGRVAAPVQDGDAQALAAMGVVVPLRAGGDRR